MMSLFPRSFCAPADAGFVPLFRLLDDFDTYSRELQGSRCGPALRRHHARQPRTQLAPFNPKFDVRETENTYELHGELPGLERENVNIEFADAQTLVIRGRVERGYGPESTNTTATEALEEESTTAATQPSEGEPAAEKPRRNSHQATVEDDPEDATTPASTTPAATPKTEATKPASESSESQAVAPAQTPSHSHQGAVEPRYWLWERSVGEFSRAFTFPARVDHDAVTASLNGGILTVSVPKAKKPVARRIEISA